MKFSRVYWKIFLLLMVFSISCSKKDPTENIIREWTNKKIIFPNSLNWVVFDRDTVCNDLFSQKYKVLIYKDSSFCNECSLHLSEWKSLQNDLNEENLKNVSFLFFINSINRQELYYILKSNNFSYPIIVDEHNEIDALNNFPENPKFQCFLLDEDNRIILVGDPTYNTNLWELYKKIIRR